MKSYFGILISLILFTGGCFGDPPKPDNLIPEEKYVSLLVELQLVRSYGENAKTDSTTMDSLTSEIFNKYSVSQSLFRESHLYYQQFPRQQKQRIQQAIEDLKMDKVSADSSNATNPSSGDNTTKEQS